MDLADYLFTPLTRLIEGRGCIMMYTHEANALEFTCDSVCWQKKENDCNGTGKIHLTSLLSIQLPYAMTLQSIHSCTYLSCLNRLLETCI